MKTAIYVEDGTVQLVLTPETDFEKNAVFSFADKPCNAKFFKGSFYDCRGGWVRQTQYYPRHEHDEPTSLILRADTHLEK